jgi:hypothetical protein
MLLVVIPDTVHGHAVRIKEITKEIETLQTKSAEIEIKIADLQCKVSASDRLSKDACQKFGDIFVTSEQPYDDFMRNWSQGTKMLRLVEETKALEEQKLLLENDWDYTKGEIRRLQDQVHIHAELIQFLGM